ncbi:response regulator [Poseidonibacter lekithochrous]|uniref:response regulator n=1 Tax=Poseidonibacter lekithochrous TaxID=1904463 RepID=UPI0008FC4167|nr:response regulator [Poseidonibacter lekithochrous]QKJ24581.1 PAS sensor-containing response regulator [Poseidonibacter lekithochrous]
MTQVEFLNKLNILYAEDDDVLREQTVSFLERLVKKVYIAKNGQEAMDLYTEAIDQNIRIDVIISDINMPKVDGIKFLEFIREKDEEIPFIFTTAFSEESYLLSAIKLNVTDYVLKPLDIEDLLGKVNKVCHAYHQLDTIKKQKKELERYLSAIDNVAIVSKTNTKGKIVFANDIFCDIAQYTREELYGKAHNMVRHPDMPKAAFKELWTTIQSGETWQGKVKNQAKDGSAYYVNATIIPIFDDFGEDIIEFVGIRFLTTDDELEKREFKKRVIQNIQDTKRKEIDNLKQIKDLESKLVNHSSHKNELLDLRDKTVSLSSQINYYEDEMKDIRDKNIHITNSANEKVKKASVLAVQLKKENDIYEKENTSLKEELDIRITKILELEKRLEEKNKHIHNLKDVIDFKEKELSNISV